MSRNDSISRRQALGLISGTVAVTPLVGCMGDGTDQPAILVSNWTGNPVEVDLVVTRSSSGEPVINEEFTLNGEEDKKYAKPFNEEGEKLIEIAVNQAMEGTITWNSGPDDTSRSLIIAIKEDDIEFTIGTN